MRTLLSAQDGAPIPSISGVEIKPLMLMNRPVTNGRGEPVMDDRWIYVSCPGYGPHAINVWRSRWIEKLSLSKITIQESIGANKLMDKDLQKFVAKVSDKLVFEKYGKWYKVYLTRITRRTFGIAKVVPYNWTVDPNRRVGGIMVHELCLNWKAKFFVR